MPYMKRDAGFYDWVKQDLFGNIPGITSRAMFGGYGCYLNGKIFGIIADGKLYFKANADSIPAFEKYNCKPFQYSAKDRKRVTMSYWEVPEEVMEDSVLLEQWVYTAVTCSKKKA